MGIRSNQGSEVVRKGNQDGVVTAIIAGVHGNEIGGVEAWYRAIDLFTIERGTVYYILGNPLAVEKEIRYVEMNLNRAFIRGALHNSKLEATYERKRAKEIMPFLDKCNALLDIHSVANERTVPFVICEPQYSPLAKKFPFPIRSGGWNTVEPGSTDYYMSTSGKPGISLECGYHLDRAVVERALEGIRIFLSMMGNISTSAIPDNLEQKEVLAEEAYMTLENFKLARKFDDFTNISKGELIGYDGSRELRSPRNAVLIFARNVDRPGEEAFILGRLAI